MLVMTNNDSHSMPNYEIRWRNFRCFKDTEWLEICPITIFLGANNSGKTSLLNPLLLLKQSWQSSDPLTPLVARGEIVDLGTYNELIHKHDPSLDLFLGLRFHTHDLNGEHEPLGKYPPGVLEVTFGSDDSPFGCILKRYKVYDIIKRPFLERRLLKSGNYSLHGELFAEMPANERRAIRKSQPINFMFSPQEAIQSLRASRGQDAGPLEKFSDQFTIYLNIVNHVHIEIAGMLRNLSYIGPLREYPRRYYERGAEIHRSVGTRGQHAPDLLRRRYHEISERLVGWIRSFGFGSSLICQDLSPDLFEILLESESAEFKANFADVGFGMSQLFPLIVQALVADPNTLTIAEQPEIHLNPRLQTLLADLFVEMATNNHSVIIETHSEHLFLRLRVLVAEGKISSENVAVYFISAEDQQSSIRRVSIESNGNIDPKDWPSGFFADTLRESLALAEAQSSQ